MLDQGGRHEDQDNNADQSNDADQSNNADQGNNADQENDRLESCVPCNWLNDMPVILCPELRDAPEDTCSVSAYFCTILLDFALIVLPMCGCSKLQQALL